jgi:beta-N-acetylhexosaminidase
MLFNSATAWSADSCPLRKEIGQMIICEAPNGSPEELKAFKEQAKANHLGGVIIYRKAIEEGQKLRSPNDIIAFTNYLQQDMNPPLFVSIDQEGGMVQRLNTSRGFTQLPQLKRLGDTNDSKLAYDFGRINAQELAAVGINFNLGVDLDVISNKKNSIISGNGRALSSDPKVVGELGTQIIRGMESHKVMTAAKHFPGHGSTEGDSHKDLPETKNWNELLKTDVLPFMNAVQENVSAIMVGHLSVPGCDDAGPTSLSKTMISGFLRKELGYKGLIITDDLSMGAITKHTDISNAVKSAVLAGEDLLLIRSWQFEDSMKALCAGTNENSEQGRALRARVKDSYERILASKRDHQLLNFKPLPYLTTQLSTAEHQKVVSDILKMAAKANPKDNADAKAKTPEIVSVVPRWKTPEQVMNEREEFYISVKNFIKLAFLFK